MSTFVPVLLTLWACLAVTCSFYLSADECQPQSARMLGWARPGCGSCSDKNGIRCEIMSKSRYEACDVNKVKFTVQANLIYKQTQPSSLYFTLRPHQVDMTQQPPNTLVVPFDVLVPPNVNNQTKMRLSVKKEKGFSPVITVNSTDSATFVPKSPGKLRVKNLVRGSTTVVMSLVTATLKLLQWVAPQILPERLEILRFELAVSTDKCRLLRNVIMQVIMRQTRSKMVVVIEHSDCEICDCSDDKRLNASECSSHGDYSCGKCECHKGFSGVTCDTETMMDACREQPHSAVCSGRGSCVDGAYCHCTGKFSGRFCECDDFSCPSAVNTSLCSGHGSCQCGSCVCTDDYYGKMCECHIQASSDKCWTLPGVNVLCGNQGECICGQCVCQPGYYGPNCLDRVEAVSPFCNYHGSRRLETCECYDNYSGEKCEIENKDHLCTAPYDTDLCSGRGECMDGVCDCAETFSGPYCECYNYACSPGANETTCSGHGYCQCGQCVCEPGYTGNACDCPLSEESCLSDTRELCNNRGMCVCGQCDCEDGYTGTYCHDWKLPTPTIGVANNVFPLYIESTRDGSKVLITSRYSLDHDVKVYWKLGIMGASPVYTKGDTRVDLIIVFSSIYLYDRYKYEYLRILITSPIGDIYIDLDVDALITRNQNGNLPNYRVNIGTANEVDIPDTGPLTLPVQMLLSDKDNYLDEFAVDDKLLVQGTKAETRYLENDGKDVKLTTKMKEVKHVSTADSKKLVDLSIEFTEDELREIDTSIELRVYFELDVADLEWSVTYESFLTKNMVISRYVRLIRTDGATRTLITNAEDTVYLDNGVGYRSITCTAFGYPKPSITIPVPEQSIGSMRPSTDILDGSRFMARTVLSSAEQRGVFKGVFTCIAGQNGTVAKNMTVVEVERPVVTKAKVLQKTRAKLKIVCEATGTPTPTIKFFPNSAKASVAIDAADNDKINIREETLDNGRLQRTLVMRSPPRKMRKVYCVAEACVPGPNGCVTVSASKLARNKKN